MSLPNIDDFKSRLKPSFTNRYQVIFPAGFGGFNGLSNRELDLLCDSITLPGRNISTNEYEAGRQLKKIPYTYTEDDITATFIENDEYGIRNYLDDWLSSIINTSTYTLGYKNEFVRDVTINQLDKKGDVVYSSILINAFPINVGGIELNNASGDIVKTSVTLAYDQYIIDNGVSGFIRKADNIISGISSLNRLLNLSD